LARWPDRFDRFWSSRWVLVLASMVYLVALVLSFSVVGAIFAQSLIALSLFGLTYVLARHILVPIPFLGEAIGWLGRQSYGLMVFHQPILWSFILWGDARVPRLLLGALLVPLLVLILLIAVLLGSVAEYVGVWMARRALGSRLRLALCGIWERTQRNERIKEV
jgi:hypothetical protein